MKKSKSSFRDKVAKDVQTQKSKGSNYGYLQLPKGLSIFKESTIQNNRCTLDIIPYIVTDNNHPDGIEVGDQWYKRPFKIHRNIGAANESVPCLTSWGKRCPICEERAKRMKAGAGKEDTDPLKPSQRNLYIIIPIGIKGYDEKPYLWDSSHFLFQNLLNDELEENPDNGIFPDLEEGLSLKIRFEENSMGKSKWFEATRIDFVEREATYDEALLEQIPNLDEIINQPTYKEVELKFFELSEEDLAEEEHAIAETVETRPLRKPKPLPEPEPEEDEEDNDEEDETPAPAPVQRRSIPTPAVTPTRRQRPVEPEPEDEEDEKPISDIKRKIPEWDKSLAKEKERKEAAKAQPVVSRPTPTKPPQQAAPASKGKCPHGYKFGEDVDKFKECNSCKVWDDCIDESEK